MQGSLAHPQNKVVGVILKRGAIKDIPLKCFGSVCDEDAVQTIELISTVNFIDVSEPSEPYYTRPPSIDVKLPHDFFYPFLPSCSSAIIATPLIIPYFLLVLKFV